VNNIGKRIKELRKKNDLTQEKLADYLGVTDKAVSKWETGITTPDLGLILPLARILQVTADELLGGKEAEAEEKRAEFDEKCQNHWKYDPKEQYQTALRAVGEFPDNYRYQAWLASAEQSMATDPEYREESEPFNREMIDRSLRRCNMVIAECPDSVVKHEAIWTAMFSCKIAGRREEALRYAEMLPQHTPYTRDKALLCCLEGEKLLTHQQKLAFNALESLCIALLESWRFAQEETPQVRAALDTAEGVLNAVFPDGNAQHFHRHLYFVAEKRAELAMAARDDDRAIGQIRIMLQQIRAYTAFCQTRGSRFTTPLLERYVLAASADGPLSATFVVGDETVGRPYTEQLHHRLTTDERYAPLQNRPDFQAILAEIRPE